MNSIYENRTGFRETFGLTDPTTGRRYEDIVKAVAITTTLDASYERNEGINFKDTNYILHLDPPVLAALRILPSGRTIQVVISYQIRTDCNIALVRLYDYRLDTRVKRRAYYGKQ